jgi:hypothetical protein
MVDLANPCPVVGVAGEVAAVLFGEFEVFDAEADCTADPDWLQRSATIDPSSVE